MRFTQEVMLTPLGAAALGLPETMWCKGHPAWLQAGIPLVLGSVVSRVLVPSPSHLRQWGGAGGARRCPPHQAAFKRCLWYVLGLFFLWVQLTRYKYHKYC